MAFSEYMNFTVNIPQFIRLKWPVRGFGNTFRFCDPALISSKVLEAFLLYHSWRLRDSNLVYDQQLVLLWIFLRNNIWHPWQLWERLHSKCGKCWDLFSLYALHLDNCMATKLLCTASRQLHGNQKAVHIW